MFVFRKIWCALFSGNTRSEIRPFTLLPTKLERQFKRYFKGFRMHSTLWFIRKTCSLWRWEIFITNILLPEKLSTICS